MSGLTAEMRLAERLRKHGVPWVFDGLTSREDRMEWVRAAITQRGLSAVVAGKNRDNKPLTYAQIFEIVYEKPLACHAKNFSSP